MNEKYNNNMILKPYRLRITAKSPIHIGCGHEIGKKEYAYLPELRQAVIIDVLKLYAALKAKGLDKDFERFYLYDKADLGSWLRGKGFSDKQIISMGRYTLDTSDADIEKTKKGIKTLNNIFEFIKDGHGAPYVPGSALKGMIRTGLLCLEICGDRSKQEEARRILDRAFDNDLHANRTNYLKRGTQDIEAKTFNTLNRYDKGIQNAVNCNLSELIVSDSRPMSTADLTISQKIDLRMNGAEKRIPLFRESLKPGTEIEFDLTVGNRCPYKVEDILEGLNCLNDIAYRYFYQKFERGSKADGTVWLGGGTGFLTKTVIYAVYGEKGVEKTDIILNKTTNKNDKEHRYEKHIRLGVSPHVCKCTRYKKKLYDMGMGKIELIQ